jgi:hypothetical protein
MDETSSQSRYCLNCGYALRGLTESQCPECGRLFDPQNPRTTAAHPEQKGLIVLAHAGKTLTILLGVAAGVAFIASALGVDTMLFFFASMLLVPLILLLLFAVLNPAVPLSPRRRMVGIACSALLVSIVWTEWPFRLMFELHRPAMNRAMQRARSGEVQTDAGPLRVGLFWFREVRTAPNGNIGFQLTGDRGGGVHVVHQWQAGGWIWYNTDGVEDLDGGWFRAYED